MKGGNARIHCMFQILNLWPFVFGRAPSKSKIFLKNGSILAQRVAKEAPGYGTCSINFWRQSAQTLRQNGAFFETTFHSKIAFFLLQSGRKTAQNWLRPRTLILSYLSNLGLGALLAHDGVVGDALDRGELVQVKDRRSELESTNFRPFLPLTAMKTTRFGGAT